MSVAIRPDSITSTCVMLLTNACRVWLNIATNPMIMNASNATTTMISISEKALVGTVGCAVRGQPSGLSLPFSDGQPSGLSLPFSDGQPGGLSLPMKDAAQRDDRTCKDSNWLLHKFMGQGAAV